MEIKEYQNYHEQKEHHQGKFPYNTYLCSIPLDFTEVPLHWHEEMELIYIKKGKGTIIVDFQEQLVEEGDFVVVLPGQLHEICQWENESMEYENIIFLAKMLYGIQEEVITEKYLRPILHRKWKVPSFFHKGEVGYDHIKGLLDRSDEIGKQLGDGYELLLKSLLYELFFQLYLCGSYFGKRKEKETNQALKKILKYVEQHYQEPIKIEDMAELVGFSESHFMRYMKQKMGQSFVEYLNDYRLTMASRMLLTSDTSVLSVATECGYSNLSYFNRLFKRKYHMTPREYRKGTDL